MTNEKPDDVKPISALRQRCKTCPYCGSIPYVDLGKQGSCQLHGEPFQAVLIHCKNYKCPAKPRVEAGDIYNGGNEKAWAKAIQLWNTRADDATLIEKVRGKILEIRAVRGEDDFLVYQECNEALALLDKPGTSIKGELTATASGTEPIASK